MKLIFDIGAHNGSNLDYYLSKADVVVAVEPNPSLCVVIENKFQEIIGSRLFIEQKALTIDKCDDGIEFFIAHHSVLSSIKKPDPANEDLFNKVSVETITIVELIERYGKPDFLKLDIEGNEALILKQLRETDLLPDSVSVELQSFDPLVELISIEKYKFFKFIDPTNIVSKYRHFRFLDINNKDSTFVPHCAGPIGDDIAGPWLDKSSAIEVAGKKGAGWFDVHASSGRWQRELITQPPDNRELLNASFISTLKLGAYCLLHKSLITVVKRVHSTYINFKMNQR